MKKGKGLIPLLLAQSQVCFNDNVAKFLLITVAGVLLHNAGGSMTVGGIVIDKDAANPTMSFLLVLPFIIFSPFAGWLADRFTKRTVINYALIAQIFILLLLAFCLKMGWLIGSVACFGLLSLQSSLYSPAKQGIVKELVAEERIGSASGLLELTTIASILAGTFFGPKFLEFCQDRFFEPGYTGMWHAATVTILFVTVTSTFAWRIFLRVPETGIRSDIPFRMNIFLDHFKQLRFVAKSRSLFWTILGIAFFYGMGGMVMLVLIQAGQDLYPGSTKGGGEAALFNLMLGVGIILGSGLASVLCRNYVELGVSVIGSLVMSIGLWMLSSLDVLGHAFYVWLIITGMAGGCFVVPLNAHMLAMAKDETRGRVIASCNLLVNIAGVIGAGLYYILGAKSYLGLSSGMELFVLSVPVFLVFIIMLLAMPETLVRMYTFFLTRVFYRIDAAGHEHFPKKGGFLIICNHLSYLDPVILSLAAKRPVKFIAFSGFMKNPVVRWVYERFNVIPVSSTRPKDAIVKAVQSVSAGDVVCIFPEGGISRAGYLMGLKEGYRVIAEKSGVPIVPAGIEGIFGSVFSFSDKCFFKKRPLKGRAPLHVTFGKPISASEANPIVAQMGIRDCLEASFSRRKSLENGLAKHLVDSLCQKKWNIVMRDYLPNGQIKEISGYHMLSMAVAYAHKFKDVFAKEKRIGVILPQGIPGALAYFALTLAGKVPVGINPLFIDERLAVTLKNAGVKSILTIGDMHKAHDVLDSFRIVEFVENAKSVTGVQGLSALFIAWFFPSKVLRRMVGSGGVKGDDEAAINFDYAHGEARGIVYTHKNIYAQCLQMRNGSILEKRERMLNVIPYCDSLSMILGLWYPVLMNRKVINTALNDDLAALERVFSAARIKVFFGPRNLCNDLHAALPSAFGGLVRCMVVSEDKAEPHRPGMYTIFGMPEFGAFVSVSQQDLPEKVRVSLHHTMYSEGSCGRVISGITVKVLDPDTMEPKMNNESGILAVRGSNVTLSYLGDAVANTKDGYFLTGFRAHLDESGFLFIE